MRGFPVRADLRQFEFGQLAAVRGFLPSKHLVDDPLPRPDFLIFSQHFERSFRHVVRCY
jgi:hypothetical protein